jgi:hypothetical protein
MAKILDKEASWFESHTIKKGGVGGSNLLAMQTTCLLGTDDKELTAVEE